jgi:hypothetical protein
MSQWNKKFKTYFIRRVFKAYLTLSSVASLDLFRLDGLPSGGFSRIADDVLLVFLLVWSSRSAFCFCILASVHFKTRVSGTHSSQLIHSLLAYFLKLLFKCNEILLRLLPAFIMHKILATIRCSVIALQNLVVFYFWAVSSSLPVPT